MKNLIIALFAINISTIAIAQDGWNWPEDPDAKSIALEKQAFYKVSIGLENWSDASAALYWLFKNNPELNPSIYIDGAKVFEELAKSSSDPAQTKSWQDSILWTYDQRIQYFDGEADVVERKAYAAFKMYYKKPAMFGFLDELYARAYELNGTNISSFNLIPYMTLAKYYYQIKPDEMTAEKVLDIHEMISEAITAKKESGEFSKNRAKKEQDKADALLSSIEGLLNCEFIENMLVPKLEADPSDLNTAKKIFSYSLKAKCSDQPYFTKAGEVLFEDNPTYELANALGNKYLVADKNEDALRFYLNALELSEDKEDKYETHVNLAKANSKLGRKNEARTSAYNALEVMPGAAEPYNILGNLYFTSYESCKGGESRVLDRAPFILAYEMYQKAGNTAQLQASKEQFPSIEEIFNEGYEEGAEVSIGCWIQKTVKLMRRD